MKDSYTSSYARSHACFSGAIKCFRNNLLSLKNICACWGCWLASRHPTRAKIDNISVLGQVARLLGQSDHIIDPISFPIFVFYNEFESTISYRLFWIIHRRPSLAYTMKKLKLLAKVLGRRSRSWSQVIFDLRNGFTAPALLLHQVDSSWNWFWPFLGIF